MGDYALDFLDKTKKPKLITCHTVLKDAEQDKQANERKKVLQKIFPKTDEIIVISNTAKNILIDEYNIDSNKINVILHGVHDFNETTEHAKKLLGLEDRFVISMVGLVRKKRGFEYVIRALPPVAEKYPEILYVIAGSTHPKEIERNREPYREFLEKEVRKLKLEDNVLFVNQYLTLNSLLRHIQASDVGITPYTDSRQVSSGVLSYNLGLEKPVISTPFLYAQEILADGRGIILPDYNNPESISDALMDLLNNREKIQKIIKKIKPFKEQMRWPNVAKKYIEVEKRLIKYTNL